MTTVLLVIHLMISAALVGIILLQKSEGGALGIGGGGGGGGGGLMSARGKANFLTRTTAILAVAFFSTSLLLAILASYGSEPRSILDAPAAPGGTVAPALPDDAPVVSDEPAEPQAPVAE